MKDYFKLRHAINALQQEHTDRQRADLERARQAEGLLESGELDAARALYEDLLSRSPRDPGLWRALGNTLMRQERHADACRALLRSLTFELDVPEAHQALGKALLLLDEAGALCDAYLASLGVAGSSLGPYHDVAQRLGDAESRFTQESTSFEASVLHMRQGHLAVARQSLDEAVLSYASAAEVHEDKWHSAQVLASALRMRGSEAEAHLVLGRAAYEIGKNRRAVRELVQGLESDSAEADDYTRLAEAYGKLEEYEGVEQACVAGAQRFVPTPNLYHAWHASLYLRNSFEQALELAERAARELGDPLLLLHERHLSVPVMYRDEHEIEPARAAFLRGLTRFEEAVEANWEAVIQRPSDVIQTNFYLHYQAKNDRDVLERHGKLIQRVMAAAHPAWSTPPKWPGWDGKRRLRIGYASADLRMHSVGKIIYGWLAEHDRTQFEVFTYMMGDDSDSLAKQFGLASELVVCRFDSVAEIARRIAADQLDILVHPGLGMYPPSTQLAALHLAPIQCAAWGHPVTTGLPTIDYFISNELMEPPEGAEHYTEELVRLPGIGVNVPRPYLPERARRRADFGLPSDAVLYVSSQSSFKYLPQYDRVYASVAERVPGSHFLIFMDGNLAVDALLRARLEASFRQRGLAPIRYLTFVKSMKHTDYFEYTNLCDVFLDTFGWSGGLTALDALGVGLPIVTCPGEFMRGRQSYGMLMSLGIRETIGETVEDYIEIAVRLGTHPEERLRLRETILQRHERLFGDVTCVRALEAFYQRAVMKRLAETPRGSSASK